MKRAWLLVLAGCGAAAPAPPARPRSVASLIDALEIAADRACACTDRDCAAIVEEDLEAQLAAPTPSLLDDPQFARGEEAMHRGVLCLWQQGVVGYAYSELTLQSYASERDRVCACDDASCVDPALDLITRELRLSGAPIRPARAEELTELEGETSACAEKLIDDQPYIRDILEIEARVCACAEGDRACGLAAQDDLRAWGERNATQTAVGRSLARLRELAREVGVCMSKTGAAVSP